MTNSVGDQGSCLCNAVKATAIHMSHKVGACHCNMCQQWTGGPILMVDCGSDVSFTGEEQITVFDSSEWAERGFCKQCGSHLFYRLKKNNQYFLPVGLFQQSGAFVLDHQIFIDEKPEYYCFSNETQNMTGAEVFAMYAPMIEP
jgi:hypothetical protein